ncbi:unnamed protein product [Arabidopsis lyrata]|nr:unnamed protein product [Arabidopsis lyrata]
MGINVCYSIFQGVVPTRSTANLRLLFALAESGGVWSFFSSPQLENPYEKSSSTLIAHAEFHARPVICNPITGRYAILPDRYTYRKAYSFFGFDPIDKQYKVLSIDQLYKGNLAVIFWKDDVDIYELCSETIVDTYLEKDVNADANNELRVWVLTDIENRNGRNMPTLGSMENSSVIAFPSLE